MELPPALRYDCSRRQPRLLVCLHRLRSSEVAECGGVCAVFPSVCGAFSVRSRWQALQAAVNLPQPWPPMPKPSQTPKLRKLQRLSASTRPSLPISLSMFQSIFSPFAPVAPTAFAMTTANATTACASKSPTATAARSTAAARIVRLISNASRSIRPAATF